MPEIKTESKVEPFILFELADATYGLRSRTVRQTEMIEHITAVPNAPDFIEGVVFSRGEVLPALNLRVRFGFPRVSHNLRTRLIVVTCQSRSVGLIVDSCREFVSLPLDTLRPPPEAVSGLSGRYLEAVTVIGSRLVFILDAGQILPPCNPAASMTDFLQPFGFPAVENTASVRQAQSQTNATSPNNGIAPL